MESLQTKINYQVDQDGMYGEFGGAYIPEMLFSNIDQLQRKYVSILESDQFKMEFKSLLKNYSGRPTPLSFAKNLSEKYNCSIYLKREDLNHTGSHKINNAIGQLLVAKQLGKKRIIAETGAGQHGVAVATVCALMGMECRIYMGSTDVERQNLNVARMKMLGADVCSVTSGSKTLKDATNEAMRDWISNPVNTHYIIGSVVGPHPFPDLVARLQSVISEEIKIQLKERTGKENPDYIFACVGGGSNAAGAFYHFLNEESVQLCLAEAGGKGISTQETAASIAKGSIGIIHGMKTFLLQDEFGQIQEPYSISAGLDYPGIGPMHAYLHVSKRAKTFAINDDEAITAANSLAKLEGIIPALESAHAIALLEKIKLKKSDVLVINLSGRGDKDMNVYANQF